MIDDKLTLERHFAESQALGMEQEQYARWCNTGSGHRIMAAKGKRIVCYSLLLGAPIVGKVLELADINVSFDSGLETTWVYRGGHVTVTHTPTEVFKGCFLWHNHLSMLEFARTGKKREARVAMTWKTQLNPKIQREGVNYLLEQYVYDDFIWESV